MSLQNRYANFNSIKVRLRQKAVTDLATTYKFQFHKGSIKTFEFDSNEHGIINFNSIKVRLRRLVPKPYYSSP